MINVKQDGLCIRTMHGYRAKMGIDNPYHGNPCRQILVNLSIDVLLPVRWRENLDRKQRRPLNHRRAVRLAADHLGGDVDDVDANGRIRITL